MSGLELDGFYLISVTGAMKLVKCGLSFPSVAVTNMTSKIVFGIGTKWLRKTIPLDLCVILQSMDSPDEYDKLRDANVKKYIQQSLSGSHNDIARALYELYGTEFICASLKHKLWFQFRNHRWQEIEEGIYLQKKISGAILEKIYFIVKRVFRQTK